MKLAIDFLSKTCVIYLIWNYMTFCGWIFSPLYLKIFFEHFGVLRNECLWCSWANFQYSFKKFECHNRWLRCNLLHCFHICVHCRFLSSAQQIRLWPPWTSFSRIYRLDITAFYILVKFIYLCQLSCTCFDFSELYEMLPFWTWGRK